MGLSASFARACPQASLAQRLPGIRSSTIGQELACLVRARQALVGGSAPSACRGLAELSGLSTAEALPQLNGLDKSVRNAFGRAVADGADLDRFWRLYEHELLHHGALLRYWRALDLPVPEDIARRYDV